MYDWFRICKYFLNILVTILFVDKRRGETECVTTKREKILKRDLRDYKSEIEHPKSEIKISSSAAPGTSNRSPDRPGSGYSSRPAYLVYWLLQIMRRARRFLR
jgi:hypothetical protein